MKTRCEKLMLIRTGAIIIPGWFVVAQDAKKEENNDVTIEEIPPVYPNLSKGKKPGAAVADFRLNAPKDQFGDNLATGLWRLYKRSAF
jgi:hypothetical protein